MVRARQGVTHLIGEEGEGGADVGQGMEQDPVGVRRHALE